MGDDIPTWKIVAVSFISAVSSVIPLRKRGLTPGDIIKYFHRSYMIPEANMELIYTRVAAQFQSPKFKAKLSPSKAKITIRRKASMRSFGEVLSIQKKGSEVVVWVRPKYFIDLFDQGQAKESLLYVEQILQQHD